VISCFNTNGGSDLIFPLSWHDLGVSSRNLKTRVEAAFVMCVHDSSTEAMVCTHWAIVGSLRAWESWWWPSKRLDSELAHLLNKGVLLFNTEPRYLFLSLGSVENLLGMNSEVSVGRH
jgi:hypothetical protein